MNEEVKDAIEYIQELIKPPLREEWDFAYKLDKTTAKQFNILLKSIRKQQDIIDSQKYRIVTQEKHLETLRGQIFKQQKEIEELGNRKAENYYNWQHLEAKIINKMNELEEMPKKSIYTFTLH